MTITDASANTPERRALQPVNVMRYAAYTLGVFGLSVLIIFTVWQHIVTDSEDVNAFQEETIGFHFDTTRRLLPPVKCGLPNIGNTCYMNSALQCLRHNTLIRNFVKRTDIQVEIHRQRSPSAQWLSAFDDLLDMLESAEWHDYCHVVNPGPIYEAMRRAAPNTFRVARRQEDALEVIHLFFEAVEQVLGRSPQAAAMWRGLVSCPEVVYQRRWGGPDGPSNSRLLEIGTDLRLRVPDQDDPIRMGVLLHRHFNEEPEDRNPAGWFQETRRLQAAPGVLIIALNRVDGSKRIRTPVQVPYWIDLSPYTEGSETRPVIYDLVAAVLHVGKGVYSGHYVATIRIVSGWLLFDDDSVRPVSHADAVSARDVWLAIFQRR